MRYFVSLPSRAEATIDVQHLPTGELRVEVNGQPVDVDAAATEKGWSVRVGAQVLELWLDGDPPDLRVVASGRPLQARVESEQSRLSTPSVALGTGGGRVRAPMPGRVVKVLLGPGAEVEPGTALVVVEAMKMENEIRAEIGGVIEEICVTAGQTVDGGATLARIAPRKPG
jgi:3-methylcrotonyl-CoA carboxylase alpha subunit